MDICNGRWVKCAACLVISASFFGSAKVMSQQIFKWTDEHGQVHYSDHAAEGYASSTVVLAKRPPPSKARATAQSESSEDWSSKEIEPTLSPEEWQQAQAIKEEKLKKESEDRAKAQRRRQAQADAAQRKSDKDVIDKCRADREVYCDKGVAVIKQEEEMRAIQQLGNRYRPSANR